MILINTNKVNLKNFNKKFYYEKFIIFLFSFLPISFILGSFAINSNILIIDLFFLFTCYRQKQWSWIKNKYFYFFISIWIYLIFNSIISDNYASSAFDAIRKEIVYPQNESIIRSVNFIRFVIFLYAVQYFLINSKKVLNQIFCFWSIIISVVLIDVIFESILGHNLLGYNSPNIFRIVSFFKDELVVGNFLLGFSFLVLGFLFKSINNNLKKKIFSNIFFFSIIICIYLSGERSNFVKAFIVTCLLLIIIEDSYLFLKKKYIFSLIIIGITMLTLVSENIRSRQIAFFKRIQLPAEYILSLKDNYNQSAPTKFGRVRTFAHYESAWQIFKDYPITGVGNRKFRYICHNEKYLVKNYEIIYNLERCSNHPHQVHLEILSEQGILGYLIIIFTILYVLLNSFRVYRKTKDIIHLSSILFVVTFFLPLLPSGSFFSTFNGSIFWINFSFVHAFLSKPNY